MGLCVPTVFLGLAMKRTLTLLTIILSWLVVALWLRFDGEIGVASAALVLLMWIALSLDHRRLSRCLAIGSVTVVAAYVVVSFGSDPEFLSKPPEAVIALCLVACAATVTWLEMGVVRYPTRRSSSHCIDDDDDHDQQSESLSIDEDVETRLLGDGEFDDDSLDSGICGAELVSQDGPELLRRADRSGAFTNDEIVAIQNAFLSIPSPVRAFKRMVADGELSKLQAMYLLWGQESQLRFGDYILIEVIGRGSSSIVYRARHAATGESIAVKIMHADEQALKRVHREMKSVRKLAHPNIVVAYDSGKIHSRFFIAMELIGSDLNRLVRDEGPLDQRTALVSVLQIALALEQAHERGILHRDVKPGNMLLTASGDVKLADLGLSCPMQRIDETGTFETAQNSLGGTLEFMAPEQVSDFRDVDARADTFALGSSLFFLLTGRSRLPGRSLAERINNLTVHKRFLRTCDYVDSPEIAALVDRLCAFDVDQRIASASEAVGAIRRTITQLGKPHHQNMVRIMVLQDNRDDVYRTLSALSETNRTLETHVANCMADVITACQAAASASGEHPFDIIFIDAGMPDFGGQHAVAELRASMPAVAIIVVANIDDDEFRSYCLATGADGFLPTDCLRPDKLEREIFVTLARRQVSFHAASSPRIHSRPTMRPQSRML
jgi:serine/threonine protein kinase